MAGNLAVDECAKRRSVLVALAALSIGNSWWATKTGSVEHQGYFADGCWMEVETKRIMRLSPVPPVRVGFSRRVVGKLDDPALFIF